jgi:Ca2+-binding EF-hand superfamily protein
VLGRDRLALRLAPARDPSQVALILRQLAEAQFRQSDRDRNGYLDEREAQASPFGGAFRRADRDGDGKVYEQEVLAYLDTTADLHARATAASVTLYLGDEGRGLFELFDADSDGQLSPREVNRLPALLGELDRNRDGLLSSDEVPHSYLLALEQGAGGAGDNPLATLEVPDVFVEKARPRGRGPVWFARMDRNRDSDLSRREFLGTDEAFRQLDADGDGLISRAEAERADASLRRQGQR